MVRRARGGGDMVRRGRGDRVRREGGIIGSEGGGGNNRVRRGGE